MIIAIKKHFYRLAAILLCSALMLGITPLAAAEEENNVIDITNIGDYGAVIGDDWEFDGDHTFIIYNDVTVTGSNYYGEALVFDIRENCSVVWKAHYSGDSESDESAVVDVKGTGNFTVHETGAIGLHGGGAALRSESGVELTVSGQISAYGNNIDFTKNYYCTAIKNAGSLLIKDSAYILASSSVGCSAIYADGDVVVGGKSQVTTYFDSNSYINSMFSVAIRSDRDIQIEITGNGYVRGYSGIIAKEADVTVCELAKVIARGWLAYEDGGLLGNAITAENVYIQGGAQVAAKNGAAVFFSGELDISGGALFAYGKGIGGASFEIKEAELDLEAPEVGNILNVVFKTPDSEISQNEKYSDSGDISEYISGNGIILAWDFIKIYDTLVKEEPLDYVTGDTTDIFVYPDDYTNYMWYLEKRTSVIRYTTGKEQMDFEVDFSLLPRKPLKYNPKEPPGTDPGTTDPGKTDPGTTDPGKTDPGTTDPGKTDPGTTDPGKTDPGTTDPGKTDPGATDPGKTDPGTTNPGNSDNSNSSGNISSNPPSNPSGSFSGNSSYAKDSGADIVYTVNKDFSQFASVKAGNSTLTRNRDYRVESGSTKITLLPAYLDTLAVGTHTFTIAFKDNTSATIRITVAASQKLPFADVPSNSWYYNAVNFVYTNGLIIGTAADKFSPESTLTRGMIVTILYRNAGEPAVSAYANPFSDVPDNTWYTDSVKWASANSIISGYGNGKFGPEDSVTKEQLALMIYRTQLSSGKTPPNTGTGKTFSDAGSISAWAQDAVTVLNSQGLFQDIPGNSFKPQNPASRVETACILYRYLAAME